MVKLVGEAVLEVGRLSAPAFLCSALPVVRFGVNMASSRALRVALRQRDYRFVAVLELGSTLAVSVTDGVMAACVAAVLSGDLFDESTRSAGT